MIEQLFEEAPQQVVTPPLRSGGDPFGNGLDALSALAVAHASKQHTVEPRKYPGQRGVRVDVRFPVHALATHKFVAVVASAAVHVEHLAVGASPAVQFGIRRARAAHTGPGADDPLDGIIECGLAVGRQLTCRL